MEGLDYPREAGVLLVRMVCILLFGMRCTHMVLMVHSILYTNAWYA
jgi:hypothetical protein